MGFNSLFFTVLFFVVATFVAAQEDECNGPNEALQCVKDCPPPSTCENSNIAFRCAYDKKKCTTKCVCKPGFYRQSYDGSCITKEQCDMCTGPNEFYSCGSACDNECATLGQQCPIVNIKCNEKCYCKNGYARNDEQICVPESQCGTVCGKNEVYGCYMPCPPDKCISLVAKFNCAANPPQCQHGCRCKEGTLRQEKGHPCKPIKHCPQMANSTRTEKKPVCGKNEEYVACKTPCPPDECISLVAKFKCAADPPCEPGCQCKSGFLRQETGCPCIPTKQCSQMQSSSGDEEE